jgi:hypothetical protein
MRTGRIFERAANEGRELISIALNHLTGVVAGLVPVTPNAPPYLPRHEGG